MLIRPLWTVVVTYTFSLRVLHPGSLLYAQWTAKY